MNRTLNMKTKKIAIGSDHAGFESKENAKSELLGLGLEVVDKGTNSLASVDYPDFAAAVGRAVVSGEVECGILICGSGIGVSIAANRTIQTLLIVVSVLDTWRARSSLLE